MSILNLLLKLRYDGKEVSSGANQSVADLRRIEQQTRAQISTNQQAASSVNTITSGYHAMAAAMGTVVSIGTAQKIVNDTASAQLLESRLQSLSGTTAEYAANQEYLFVTADKLNISYEALAGSFTSMLNLQRSGTVTMAEGKAITEGLANAGAALGASNDQLANSLYGLNQALSSGVLQTDELNQVMDPLPGLLGELDKQVARTGMTFRQLTGTGQVTSAMFKQYLIEALKSYEGAAERTEGKISASLAEMGNAYQRLIREYEKDVNFGVVAIANVLRDSMNMLRENETLVKTLEVAVIGLALGISGRLVGALTSSTTAKLKDIQATRAQQLAEREKLAAVAQVATVEHARALQMQAYYQHTLKVAQSDHLRGVAITNLAAANQRAIATQQMLNQATANYEVVANKATLATSALKNVTALIGGLPGVITIAGMALLTFAGDADAAAVSISGLDERVTSLQFGLDSLGPKGRLQRLEEMKTLMATMGNESKALEAQLKQTQAQLENGFKIKQNPAYQLNKLVVPLTTAEKSLLEKQITELDAQLEQKQMSLAALKLDAERLSKPLKPTDNKGTPTNNGPRPLPTNIQELQRELLGEEAKIKESYQRRRDMVAMSMASDAANKQKYTQLLKAIDAAEAKELSEQQQKALNEKIRAENEARRKIEQDKQDAHQTALASARGFASREAAESYANAVAVEQAKLQGTLDAQRRASKGIAPNDELGELRYDTETEKLRMAREQQLMLEQGFQSQREADAAAHEERLFQIRAEKTGQLRGTVVQFANFERKTTAEKTSAILELGEQGFKAMASQSKTAFKAYKAFSIGQALIKTYESATGAYAALAPIPVVGPALGAAAAAAAVAMGLGQVRMIQQQQPAGIAHGGLDYVPSESTYVLQRGERVLSPRQNVEISEQVRRIDERSQSQGAGGNVNLTVVVHSQGGVKANAQMEQRGDKDYIVNLFLSDVQNGGEMARTLEQTYQLKRAG